MQDGAKEKIPYVQYWDGGPAGGWLQRHFCSVAVLPVHWFGHAFMINTYLAYIHATKRTRNTNDPSEHIVSTPKYLSKAWVRQRLRALANEGIRYENTTAPPRGSRYWNSADRVGYLHEDRNTLDTRCIQATAIQSGSPRRAGKDEFLYAVSAQMLSKFRSGKRVVDFYVAKMSGPISSRVEIMSAIYTVNILDVAR
ncbi:hypothetical protein K438DRAFT_1774418 [Mycena galopus ATCC 62051]|nr:hypothetical protein K438DRAFT_1774418 [Mycena galopus ATCC 62051]